MLYVPNNIIYNSLARKQNGASKTSGNFSTDNIFGYMEELLIFKEVIKKIILNFREHMLDYLNKLTICLGISK